MGLEGMPGATAPFKGFDPLNLATLGSESTFAWFRASELKHSRIAMLATTGYLVQAAGVHFPGQLSSDVSFESLSTMKPLDAWTAVPDAGTTTFLTRLYICRNLVLPHTHNSIFRKSSNRWHDFPFGDYLRVCQHSLHQGWTPSNYDFPSN